MRKLLVLILLLISICLPVQANEQDIVNSFTNFVNSIINPIEQSYQNGTYVIKQEKPIDGIGNPYLGLYYKSQKYNLKYTYDLKKTDSLINPYIGTIDICNGVKHYERCKTEDLAKANNTIRYNNPEIRYNRFTYKYQNGQWIKSRVQYFRNGYFHDEYMSVTENSFMFDK